MVMFLNRRSHRPTHNAVSSDATRHLDLPVKVIRPRAWIALTALVLLMMAGLGWAFFGELPETIEADGILMREGGLWTVTAPVDGIFESCVAVGDSVEASDRLAVIRTMAEGGFEDREVPVFFRKSAQERRRVLRQLVEVGQRVRAGDALLQYEIERNPRQVVVFLDRRRGYHLIRHIQDEIGGDKRELEAHVLPENAKLVESGYLIGKVVRVAEYPATVEQMASRLGDRALARQWFETGRNLEVVISLNRDSTARNGYQWSAEKGKTVPLLSGVPCRVRIVVKENLSPLRRIFPMAGSE